MQDERECIICSKYILKETFRNILPRKVLNRKHKMGFPVPLDKWYKKGTLRDFVFDILKSKSFRERGFFDASQVEYVLDNGTSFNRSIWGIIF